MSRQVLFRNCVLIMSLKTIELKVNNGDWMLSMHQQHGILPPAAAVLKWQ